MERITAGNLIIEQDSERWRLLMSGEQDGADRLLFEVQSGADPVYADAFARRRALPVSGGLDNRLPAERIDRVVVGWSDKDRAWHLGLMLDPAFTEARGSRWCGLASWEDASANGVQAVAAHVGQSLAHKLARPFAVVPPKDVMASGGGAYVIGSRPDSARTNEAGYPGGFGSPDGVAAPMSAPLDTSEVRHPIQQPALPLKIDDWTLQPIEGRRVELALSKAWARVRFWRAGWYIVLAAIFLILTVTTLTSGIALPRPEFLVYMGMASVVVMIAGVIVTLGKAIRYPKRIVFDGQANRVVWLRGRGIAGEVPPGTLDAVYVSHVVSKVGGWAKDTRRVRFGELNLRLRDGSFVHVLTVPRTDESIPTTDDPFDEESVLPLTVFNARTRLQSAGLAIAETLGVPAMYDKRLR